MLHIVCARSNTIVVASVPQCGVSQCLRQYDFAVTRGVSVGRHLIWTPSKLGPFQSRLFAASFWAMAPGASVIALRVLLGLCVWVVRRAAFSFPLAPSCAQVAVSRGAWWVLVGAFGAVQMVFIAGRLPTWNAGAGGFEVLEGLQSVAFPCGRAHGGGGAPGPDPSRRLSPPPLLAPTGTKHSNACMKHLCSDAESASHELRFVAVELATHGLRSAAGSSSTQRRTPSS